jgi:hypothetical protein
LALAGALGAAHAAPPPSLEDAFWACDYIATTRGTDHAPGEICAAVYEEVKATKFGGSFEELVAWWQVNKAGAHARIAASTTAAFVEPVASAPAKPDPAKPSRAARLAAATRAYLAVVAAVLGSD